ncbi:MAG: DUF4399 domain-containing protein [Cyanobacteria bacterium P01_D01_bin.1]
MNSVVSALSDRIKNRIEKWLGSATCLAVVWFLVLWTVVPDAIATPVISHAPVEAKAYLISPTDGQTVPPEFTVKFGLSGMGIAPAGIDKDKTGHHHLLVDVDELPSLENPLPSTARIKHFGGGQTEATIQLAPGKHTLQLLLGNYAHTPHDNPVLSEPIEITVREQ